MPVRHDTSQPRSNLWDNDHVAALDDLDDVTITAAATDDLIYWNGSAWVNKPILDAMDDLGMVGTIVMSVGITDPPEPVWSVDGAEYIYSVPGQ